MAWRLQDKVLTLKTDCSLSSECLLFDRVVFKNRLKCGGLLLLHFEIS